MASIISNKRPLEDSTSTDILNKRSKKISPISLMNTHLNDLKVLFSTSTVSPITDEIGILPSRNLEYNKISKFIRLAISSNKSASLYITGPPGTGKTEQVSSILLNQFIPTTHDTMNNTFTHNFNNEPCTIININCLTLSDPSYVYKRIIESATKNKDSSTVKKNINDLTNFIKQNNSHAFIVVLDELDKLAKTTNLTRTKTLFDLFLLSKQPDLRFILIGISNSLDLTDRFLTRLNQYKHLLPTQINFNPYTYEQMVTIINFKLSQSSIDSLMHPMAVQFVCKKCSSNSGDLRKLFDVIRQSIEVLQLDLIKQKKTTTTTNETQLLPQIKINHIAKVFTKLNNISNSNFKIAKLNMQQKLVLCSIINRETTDLFHESCNIDDSYEYYFELLRKREISPLLKSEYLEVLESLNTHGVIGLGNTKKFSSRSPRERLVKSNVERKELENEVQKIDILRSLL